MSQTRVLFVLLVLLCSTHTSLGGAPESEPGPDSIESALNDYAESRYDDAAGKLKILAARGNAEAQYFLGLMYRRGHGVPVSNETAIEWYRKAAAQGYALAENNLGFMYFKGLGVEVNEPVGYEWYMAAAKHGDINAQYNVGLKLFYGRGVSKDLDASLRWFLKASFRGCREAINFAGHMYQQGLGTAVDPARAALWFRLGEEAGDPKSAESLENMRLENPELVADSLARFPDFRKGISIETMGVDPGSICAWQ